MAKEQGAGGKKSQAKAAPKKQDTIKAPLFNLKEHAKAVTALAFAPDGRTLVSGSADGEVRLWEVHRRECCAVFGGEHAWRVVDVPFSPDGKMVAIVWQGVKGQAQGKTSVELWDLITRRRRTITAEEKTSLRSPCFSGDGRILAVKSDSVWLFDAYGGEVIDKIPAKMTASSMALSPDGRQLALGGVRGEVRLRDNVKKTDNTLHEQKGLISHLAFSPAGEVLASASTTRPPLGKPPEFLSPHADHTVRLWDAASGEPMGEAAEVGEATASLVILADGQSWMSVDGSGDAATVHRGVISSPDITSWKPNWGGVCSAAVSSDGRLVALGDENGEITLWSLGATP